MEYRAVTETDPKPGTKTTGLANRSAMIDAAVQGRLLITTSPYRSERFSG
jgi:hypothetical protein